MNKIEHHYKDINGAMVAGKLLLVNNKTNRYYIEKNKVVAAYIVEKLFNEQSLKVSNSLDLHANRVYDYLNAKLVTVDEDYVVYFEVTNRCNLKCKHCYNNSNAYSENSYKELSMQNVEKVLNENRANAVKVILSGGEPTLHSQFREMLTLLHNRNILTTVYTNGIDVADYIELFRKLETNIVVSLDGTNREEHEIVRGKGSFDRTNKMIKQLVSELDEGKISIAYTVTQHNVESVSQMFSIAANYGIKRIFINPVALLGRNRENGFGLNANQLVLLWNQINCMREKYDDISVICDTHWKADFIKENKTIPRDCSICRKLRVSVDGDVYPCTFFDDKTILHHNVISEPADFSVVPQYHKVIEDVNERVEVHCSDCILRIFCNGGCPAAGYSNSNWEVSEVECDAKSEFFYGLIKSL